ncbi:MAG: calcium/sodium antiporter [Silicimonas sp.]|nr:calcium/sodium antiporter [Silicimonas sp.]
MVWLTLVLGLAILLTAGDLMVRGAVNLALRLGIPALIVSLTIVAFGTSAPELIISVQSVLEDAPGLALGNAVGSNTANVLLVLGVPALVSRLHTSGYDTRKSYVAMIGASVMFIALCTIGPLTWGHGLVLLVLLGMIIADQARAAIVHRRETDPEALEGADPSLDGWKIAVFIILGLIGLPLGADLFVDSAVDIARQFGISESAIGLSLVALGTSMPELATTVMAAIRRQADVALGNVIGSNIFNLLAIIGVATLVGPIPVADSFLRFDLWVMLGASLLMLPFVFKPKWDLTRRFGVILTALYIAYMITVVGQG